MLADGISTVDSSLSQYPLERKLGSFLTIVELGGIQMIPNLIHLPANPTLKGQAELIQDVPYSKNDQTLTLILPWAPNGDRTKIGRIPLIVFVQGSGWTTPNLNYELPMLCHYAEEGIAVATVRHRSTADGAVFPAFLIDVKCAIRFLRAHAEEYGIHHASPIHSQALSINNRKEGLL